VASTKSSLLKTNALLVVVLGHFGLLYLLYHLHPSKYVLAHTTERSPPEQVTQITFIMRPKKIKAIITEPIITPKRRQENNLQIEYVEKNSTNSNKNKTVNTEPEPLNLSLPEAVIDFNPQQRDILERQRNTVEYQSTRFNNSYKPSGNAVDSLKWKSKTVNLITGLFGGNMKMCTDEDRKNRLPRCVPDAYREEY
jgi:hypothetical protein